MRGDTVGAIPEILLILSWSCAVGAALTGSRRAKWRGPILTSIVCGATAAVFLVQLADPPVLAALQRDASQILLHGQWWRVFTALFVQDGWWPGALTNLSALLLIGSIGEQALSRPAWLAIYGLGALLAELVALDWQPIGGGNSVGVCALAGALVAHRPSRVGALTTGLRLTALASAALLLALRDIHGVGILAGAAIATGLSAWPPTGNET